MGCVEDTLPMDRGVDCFRMIQVHYISYAEADLTGGSGEVVIRAIGKQL